MDNTPAGGLMSKACQIPIKELDPEAARHPKITDLFDYWCGLNNGHPPARKAFDFMSVYHTAPNLLMAERVDERSFKFIYCGTFVADNFPLDLTGKVFTPQTARISRVNWPGFFSESILTPSIRYGREPVDWPNDVYKEILYGVFPLAGEDGQCAFALACLIFLEKQAYDRVF